MPWAQVYVYRLPDLPKPGARGYSGAPLLLQPSSAAGHSPAFGSAGLAISGSGDTVFVGSPAAPQARPVTGFPILHRQGAWEFMSGTQTLWYV